MKIIASKKINAKLKALLRKAKSLEDQDEYIVVNLMDDIGATTNAKDCLGYHIREVEDQFPDDPNIMMDEGIDLAFEAKGKPIIKATIEAGDDTCGDKNHFYWLAKESDVLKKLDKIEVKPDEDDDEDEEMDEEDEDEE